MSEKTGANIKNIRRSLGYTQTDVAEKLFTTAQNISRVESGEGEPTVEMLLGLSNLFGVSIDTLLCNDTLSESELMDKVRTHLKKADRDEMPEKVFRTCKTMLLGRFDSAVGENVTDLPTYSTLTARNITSVLSDIPERPQIFAAVGTNAVDLNEEQEKNLASVFTALSDREVLRIIKILSKSPMDFKSYDKTSFCNEFEVEEADFEKIIAHLTTLKLITAKTVHLNDSTITTYRPTLCPEIVILLTLSDLLYNASPDGSAH